MPDHSIHQEVGCRLPTPKEVVSFCGLGSQLTSRSLRWLRQALPLFARNLALAFLHIVTWRGWVDSVALAFLAGLAVYFFRDAFLTQRIFYENDTATFYYPLTSRFDQSLEEGVLPFWTRSIFAGYPLYADGETGMFYPLNLLLFQLLPAWPAFLLRRVLTFTIGAWGMYAFGRAMGFRHFGAALAGVAFTYGSFLIAQLHHANVVNSAVWIPWIFFAVELALRSQGRRRFQWLAIGGVVLGIQCLAVHVQVVLMTLLALGLYLGYRALLGPVAVQVRQLPPHLPFLRRMLVANANVWLIVLHRSTALVGALVLVVLVGLGIGAVQLLPLYQLAQFSSRGSGVEYAFASTFALPRLGLLQALFPYLFRSPAGGGWERWASWETALYVGIPTLVFALVGIFFARNRHTCFFLGLVGLGGVLALGPNSPLNLHHLLWELPGFSSMRAPGRFSFLVIFGAASLAGWGAHWLDMRLSAKAAVSGGSVHLWRSSWFSLFLAFATFLPFALTLAVLATRSWMEAKQGEVLQLLRSGDWVQLRNDASNALDLAYQGLRWALDMTNPVAALSIGLLLATALVLLLWYGAPQLGYLAKGALLGLLVVDLHTFGAAYHPLISFGELTTPSPATAYLTDHTSGNDRVLSRGLRLRSLEANRLMPLGVPMLNGYSSVPPERNLEYMRLLRDGHETFPDILVDMAGVRYIARDATFTPLPFYKFVSFDPGWPLAQGVTGNPGSQVTFDGEGAKGDTVVLVTALRDGVQVPQGAALAQVSVVTSTGERRTAVIQAGHHVSEWAYERPDVTPLVRHGRAETAFTFQTADPDRRVYNVNLYYAELSLGRLVTAKSVEFRHLYPVGSLRLYGLALLDSKSKALTQIRTKTKYRLAYQDQEAVIHENTSALPKAYVVGQGMERPSDSRILWDMVEGAFDPRQTVILEDPAGAGFTREPLVSGRPLQRPESRPFFAPAKLIAYDSTSATLQYDTSESGYLVFTDSYYPGWEALLDSSQTPIYRANYLFRAVRAPAGHHTVEFRFNPSIFRLGQDTTLLSLGLAGLVLVLPELWALARLLARTLAAWRRTRRGCHSDLTLRTASTLPTPS